ncbi:PREDICTED: mucin-20 [Galeopterus variegatus]|uniref:Mucin-20 n=1 Tax=Galeopterus variegatus TaxID=482537 RepID=A0ABM0QKM3_GALVR|nr:PREDICTED: mucin-20 [Galeopterus variegatus]
MGSLWGLGLPLFFCCWEAGVSGSSAGPSTSRPELLVTTNNIEVTAVSPEVRTSSEGAFQTNDLTETSAPGHVTLETQTLRILTPAGTIREADTRETKTISLATETMTLKKTIPSKFMVMISSPTETSAPSGSPSETRMTTVESVTGSKFAETIFDTLCTDDSSEEARRITIDVLTLADTAAQTEGLSSESSASSDNSLPAITTSQVLAPDVITPAKALVVSSITHIEVTNCSITEMETTATIPGVSVTDHSLTEGGKALSTSETSALPASTEAKSHILETTTSAGTLSTTSTAEPATPDTTAETPLPTNSTTERETTAAKATTPNGALVTVSMNTSEGTSALSVETPSHTEVSRAVTVSTEAGSTAGKAISSAGSSAFVYSSSEIATIKKSTPSETPTTDSATHGHFPISKSPLPSVHLTTDNSSQETNITLAKITTSAKTPVKPPAATPTTAQTRQTTKVTADEEEGFLLLRLSVASPIDLTEPRVAERLMQQLRRELHAHKPPIQVSLLRVRRR